MKEGVHLYDDGFTFGIVVLLENYWECDFSTSPRKEEGYTKFLNIEGTEVTNTTESLQRVFSQMEYLGKL